MKTDSLKTGGHMIDIIFTLALFCVFAASALLVVLIGANVYKNTMAEMNKNFNTRTSVTYISTKVHQNDAAGSIYLERFDAFDALVLEEEIAGQVYETRIYHYDGELRELLCKKDTVIEPADGQVIMNVAELTMEQVQDDLLRVTSVDENGNRASLLVSLRCR